MKTALRILGGRIGVVLLVGIGLVVFVQARGIPHYDTPAVPALAATPHTPAQFELGEKLVRASCAGCHLNSQTNRLSGHQLLDTPKEFGGIFASNITQDPAHGISQWTDQEVVGLLRTGIGREGRYRVVMLHFVYMSDEDMNAIMAFLHSTHPWVQADPTPNHEQETSFLLKALTNSVMKPTPVVAGSQVAPAPTDALA